MSTTELQSTEAKWLSREEIFRNTEDIVVTDGRAAIRHVINQWCCMLSDEARRAGRLGESLAPTAYTNLWAGV